MRRKEREVTDPEEKLRIIEECLICRLGLSDEGRPYIVPMNFGFEFAEGRLTLYFHAAQEGRKIRILKKNPSVFFEMDCGHETVSGDTACAWSLRYKSVMGEGTAAFVHERAGKIHALDRIMAKVSGRTGYTYEDAVLDKTAIIRVTADNFTAKERK